MGVIESEAQARLFYSLRVSDEPDVGDFAVVLYTFRIVVS